MTEYREEQQRVADVADDTNAVRRQSIESDRATEPQVLDREVERTRRNAGPADAGSADAGPADAAASSRDTALLAPDIVENLKARWTDVQAGFVDEPRRAVQQADGLVTDAIQGLAQSFGSERARLEAQWDRGSDVSTEELRLALQRYRAFFSRLLTI